MNYRGEVQHKFVQKGQLVNKEYYLPILWHLHITIPCKRPYLATENSRNAKAKHETATIMQSLYSSNLAHCDSFFFWSLSIRRRRWLPGLGSNLNQVCHGCQLFNLCYPFLKLRTSLNNIIPSVFHWNTLIKNVATLLSTNQAKISAKDSVLKRFETR